MEYLSRDATHLVALAVAVILVLGYPLAKSTLLHVSMKLLRFPDIAFRRSFACTLAGSLIVAISTMAPFLAGRLNVYSPGFSNASVWAGAAIVSLVPISDFASALHILGFRWLKVLGAVALANLLFLVLSALCVILCWPLLVFLGLLLWG